MKSSRTVAETAIICASGLIAFGMVVLGRGDGLPAKAIASISVVAVIGIAVVLGFRYLTTAKKAKLELSGGEAYRQLADEYRRLSDMAITAQEHLDLKLGDVSVRLELLQEQMTSLQRILKEVE